uniref:Uncharacterized protein n=1 Tax=Arundo donax TaxID=35708 RepID=A0A0A9HIZ4_ARUDO
MIFLVAVVVCPGLWVGYASAIEGRININLTNDYCNFKSGQG